ncbi:hypothetical protein [Streptomyces sp. NPDC097610]|uniref:hypothetical protein n=1 Tax=Streptomyces sp. NPDC097610 TaxID=3157227 RepID=UPI00332A89DA
MNELAPATTGTASGSPEAVMDREIGMDIHRDFAPAAMVEDGLLRDAGQIGCRPQELGAWAATLREGDEDSPLHG